MIRQIIVSLNFFEHDFFAENRLAPIGARPEGMPFRIMR
jgi:hypothetical protein